MGAVGRLGIMTEAGGGLDPLSPPGYVYDNLLYSIWYFIIIFNKGIEIRFNRRPRHHHLLSP